MRLDKLQQPPLNTTMMGVLKGAADCYGIKASVPMLYGGSGHAFLINIHDQICPSGPYCWNYKRFYELVKNLGIEMIELGFFARDSSPEARAGVEQKVKEALDRKLPCALNSMENQLIYGYDEEKFSTAQPWPKLPDFPPATLTFGSWKELGNEVHITFFVFDKLAAKDDLTIIRESLTYAVDLFRNPDRYNFERYGIGPIAYDNWAKAKPEHLASHGNWWNAEVWSECRAMASQYFLEISNKNEGDTKTRAKELSTAYKEISELLRKIGNKEMPAAEKVGIVGALKQQEQKAIGKVEEFLKLLG